MPTDEQLLQEITRLKNAISRKTATMPPAAHQHAAIPPTSTSNTEPSLTQQATMVRTKRGSLVAASRLPQSKSTVSHSLRHPRGSAYLRSSYRLKGHPISQNRRLTRPRSSAVNHRSHSSRLNMNPWSLARRPKPSSIDEPCRKFTTRGFCNNGMRCPYQHNPEKVAICPRFMNDDCISDPCLLSHKPTPERVPVCVHFSNGARCRRGSSCKYPHVKLSRKEGVCRDFAILGYCGRGLDCEKQHIRECPDFTASGTCPNPRCKLPHIIRAKHTTESSLAIGTDIPQRDKLVETEEFIPLTFDESSEDEASGLDLFEDELVDSEDGDEGMSTSP